MPGYVYILSNRHMPGIVKIGRSDRHPAERAAELSRPTGVPSQFTLEGCVQVANPRAAEAKLHAIFADTRAQRREFFSVSVLAALEAVSLFGEPQGNKIQLSEPPVAPGPVGWFIWLSITGTITALSFAYYVAGAATEASEALFSVFSCIFACSYAFVLHRFDLT